ncbi:MAG: hypothetical protein ACREIV_11970 [Planctomycetaceae bacterium]
MFVVVVALIAAGCGGNEDDPSAIPSRTGPPTVTPSPDPTLTPEEQAVADAEAAVTAFVAASDELWSSAEADLRRLDEVAAEPVLSQLTASIEEHRVEGNQRRGAREAIQFEVTNVQLAGPIELEGGGTGAAGLSVSLTACMNLSAVEIVDADGNSLENPDAPDRRQYVYFAANRTPDDASGWRVWFEQPETEQASPGDPPEVVAC